MLDQGFPKPPGFLLQSVDKTVEAQHLSEFEPQLSINQTPDWLLYCRAAEAGFDALVARDRAQLDQQVEMFTLDRLQRFTVITWRRAIEDPIREWGQLLAYLPLVKRWLGREPPPKAILLPEPKLTQDNIWNPRETLADLGQRQGISTQQIRFEARQQIRGWLEIVGEDPGRFDSLLGLET